ncbi:ABC transporter permease [Sphaerisporangium rubeum]|uniref:Tetrahydromethanopterin S-methyltransferase subunit F n=1 Tax=Sphaerisporangium rubeum TaxID=321317 RepID=A0A7X0IH13_9ACTN|nr:ABC transporter permease [Sphaerisporangium rubeum]MBB6475080.1 tetrahydromethanopterin S-methyltransferase subunit F [Sphaerisporangium rubeum]
MRGRTPLVLRRAFSEPLLVFAAFGSILLATTTLVALTLYASTVADVGVKRAMLTAPTAVTATTVSASIREGGFPAADGAVRGRIGELTAGPGGAPVPHEISLSAQSDSYAMPDQQRREHPELTRFGTYDGLDRQARLLEGSWPRPATGGTVEAALSQPAADAMDLGAGQEFVVVGRLDHKPVRVTVTGVYQLRDPYAERWTGQELLRKGVERGDYTTYGPLMVPRETFLARFTTSVNFTWTAVPDLSGLDQSGLRPFAAAVDRLGDALTRDCPTCETYSRLPDMLTDLDRAALVARSTMLVPVLQLLLLAAYALVLTARLLADHRRMEVALLRSRGAGSVWLGLLAGAETLLVAVPCALVAPFLAPPLLRLVNSLPWIKAAGVDVAAEPDGTAFAVSAGVALACAVLLALPALRGARRTYIEEQSLRGRGDRQGWLQRAGGDVALAVVAALAIWQLRRYGAPVTTTSSGDLGIDPLIVTGPALALLCGGMLGLRLVPRVSRLAERVTSRRRSLAPALGSWQVSRRPARYSGPALLLTMAVAIGVVSMATAATWRGSQLDQARHQAGADLRVAAPPESAELGGMGRGAAYAALPGVTAVSPVHRGTVSFSQGNVTILAADAAKLGTMVTLRDDLSPVPMTSLAGRLAAARPPTPSVPLPGTPGSLSLDVRLRLDRPEVAEQYVSLRLRMVLVDALGVQRHLTFGPLDADGAAHRLTADLAGLAGQEGRLAYPLAIRGFAIQVPVPFDGSGLELALDAIATGDGTRVTLPSGLRWGHLARREGHVTGEQLTTGPGLFTVKVPKPSGTQRDPAGPEDVSVVAAPADVPDEALFAAPPADGGPGPAGQDASIFRPVPVVVTSDVAAREKLTVGGAGVMQLDGRPVRITVAGIVAAMPGTAAGAPAVLADLPTLTARDVASGREPRAPLEWWMSAENHDSGPAAAELARHPDWDQTVVDIGTLTRQLRDDPLASGLQGALILGFAAALVFAALGFLVNAAVAARERGAEFAILRALGVSFRQIFGLLAVEQAFLIGLSVAGGTLLAVVVATLVVPHIVLTGQASLVTPPVLLDIPWPATLAMLAAVSALLFAIVAALARSLRRQGLGRALRIGEDR